ncbi:MAG: hypothetical protein PHP50_07395 [Lachnospiraceae bacterium]|nr:hypothetical protein [Lachnospiraceae bacterium]
MADQTEAKSLDDLAYIQIPLELFPCDLLPDNETVQDCIDTMRVLSDQKIVNLTGYSNTDLKLEYGAPNIRKLIAYDQNYTILARTLQKWATLLQSNGYAEEAIPMLEFAISTQSDVSATYHTLAEYYQSHGEKDKIQNLKDTAEELRSAMKPSIIHMLEAYA